MKLRYVTTLFAASVLSLGLLAGCSKPEAGGGDTTSPAKMEVTPEGTGMEKMETEGTEGTEETTPEDTGMEKMETEGTEGTKETTPEDTGMEKMETETTPENNQ